MQFIDLHAQYQALQQEIDENIRRVLEHGKYIMGPEVGELEEKLAAYAGRKHCITCANGTDALSLVLMAWGIGPGAVSYTHLDVYKRQAFWGRRFGKWKFL